MTALGAAVIVAILATCFLIAGWRGWFEDRPHDDQWKF